MMRTFPLPRPQFTTLLSVPSLPPHAVHYVHAADMSLSLTSGNSSSKIWCFCWVWPWYLPVSSICVEQQKPLSFIQTRQVNQLCFWPASLRHDPSETCTCHGKIWQLWGKIPARAMNYFWAYPEQGLFMFSWGDMQGHPKQNGVMLYYSTALLQTWENARAYQ